ncbi:hypothetical protein QBC37DRAFT_429016 [Rhypophila decipiens]|uniref:Secreted protein n=1 Tax=Rhypophila decipiens TaxID=261697 RepID=A0AAN6Y105_9PEZI|nr:hypothetical protein QBC37DRAFT_429016 [Rhypophila decipiens]
MSISTISIHSFRFFLVRFFLVRFLGTRVAASTRCPKNLGAGTWQVNQLQGLAFSLGQCSWWSLFSIGNCRPRTVDLPGVLLSYNSPLPGLQRKR